MTGFGEGRRQTERLSVLVQARAVNNRHLKVTVRGSAPYPLLESDFEKLVRQHMRRGSVTIHVRVERTDTASPPLINIEVLRAYVQQIQAFCLELGQTELMLPMLSQTLTLPGVVDEQAMFDRPPDAEWQHVQAALQDALGQLDAMRQREGEATTRELLHHLGSIRNHLAMIQRRLPTVLGEYRERLLGRIRQVLAESAVTIEPDQLLREMALFSDRIDVSEEVSRLSAHLQTFEAIIRQESDSPGRKLEFLIQEMGRETNTLGSKLPDVTASHHVIEIKAALEKIREQLQNIE